MLHLQKAEEIVKHIPSGCMKLSTKHDTTEQQPWYTGTSARNINYHQARADGTFTERKALEKCRTKGAMGIQLEPTRMQHMTHTLTIWWLTETGVPLNITAVGVVWVEEKGLQIQQNTKTSREKSKESGRKAAAVHVALCSRWNSKRFGIPLWRAWKIAASSCRKQQCYEQHISCGILSLWQRHDTQECQNQAINSDKAADNVDIT